MAEQSNLIRNIVIAVVVGIAVVILISMFSGPSEQEQAEVPAQPASVEPPTRAASPERMPATAPSAAVRQGASPEAPRVARPLSDIEPREDFARADRIPPPPTPFDPDEDPNYVDPSTLEVSRELPPELARALEAGPPEMPEDLRLASEEPVETPPELIRAMEDARYLETPPEIQEAIDNAGQLEAPPDLQGTGGGR